MNHLLILTVGAGTAGKQSAAGTLGANRPIAIASGQIAAPASIPLAQASGCDYCNYAMKTLALKLTRIGNSKGVRLPMALIKRYGFSGSLAVEAREEGLLLKPKKPSKLSWEETARAMAASDKDWSEWDSTAADGLETCPWDEPAPASVQAWAQASGERERGLPKPNRRPAKR